MQMLLKVTESKSNFVELGRGCQMLPVKAFRDDSSSNTLSCLQVYLPLARTVLQELRTCSNVWGFSLHRGQVGSLSFFHLTRLLFNGSRSYVERIKKLNLTGAICQMPFQLIDFCRASSQLVHWLCWDLYSFYESFVILFVSYFQNDHVSGNFSFACLQYIATSDKSWGNPNHFRVYLFIFSTVLVEISYTRRGHNSIWINTCWRHHTLYFPCRGHRSILNNPSCNVLDVSFTWLIFFIDSSYQCPIPFTGRSDTVGILWPPISKLIDLTSLSFERDF